MKTSQSKHPFIRLLSYANQYRLRIWLASLFSVINKLFDLAPPILIGAAVDVVTSQQDSFVAKFGIVDVKLQLWALATATVIIWGVESITDYIAEVRWRNLAQDLEHNLRLAAFTHLQQLELAYFEDRHTGELMAVLNDDVNQLERFLDSGAHEMIILVTTVVVVGALFVGIVPSVAWMAILPIPFVAWGSIYFQRLIAPRYAAVREQAGLINGRLANTLGGIATVKSFTAEQHEIEEVSEISQEYRARNYAAIRFSSAFVPIIRIVIVLGFAAIMVYGGEMAIAGTLNVGAYSILVFMTQRLLWPITRLGTTLDLYQRAIASTDRVLKVLSTEPTIAEGSSKLPLDKVKGDIAFEQVSFAYSGRSEVLSDFSIAIKAGESIGFVGSTGSGKTTLIKLLLRFYDVSNGSIFLDGIDIRKLRTKDLRRAISLVSQDVFLIDGTVQENISYGTFAATEQQIISAAKIAEADDFITKLPQGYDTLVGERGQKLSGGQRQRISIARAVLKDSPIVILDEATSSVDNETEAAIQRAMHRISKDRTMIVVAHRLSTVRHVNKIFVLENGKVVECGAHEDLLAKGGIYSTLWNVQTGESELG